VRFLRAARRADGGFGATARLSSNAQSTAWAVQAFVAAGVDARRPLAYLRSLADTDGSVRYNRTSRQSPVWVTAQALAALARKRLPVR
jgi:energy-coupling factor transport system substrate-specific component